MKTSKMYFESDMQELKAKVDKQPHFQAKMTLIYTWVKQNHIDLTMFLGLVDYVHKDKVLHSHTI